MCRRSDKAAATATAGRSSGRSTTRLTATGLGGHGDMDRSAEVPGRLPSNTRRPDVGRTDNDLEPEIDGEGKPSNFTQIDETRHMKFHSGAIRTIAWPRCLRRLPRQLARISAVQAPL